MNKTILKRLDHLSKAVEQVAAERARYAPYFEVMLCSIVKDEARLVYRPAGIGGPSEKIKKMSVAEALSRANGTVFIRMIFCPEWVHSFYMSSPLYSLEQKKRFREADIAHWPEEIGWIYAQGKQEKIISTLAAIPQSFRLKETLCEFNKKGKCINE